MKLLIDGDILCYRAGFATDKTKYMITCSDENDCPSEQFFDDAKSAKAAAPLGAFIWSRRESEPEDKALMLVDVMIGDIRSHYAAESPSIEMYLTGVGNYRHSVATRASYKGNRAGQTPPTHLKAIRNHLIARGAVVSHGEEADDLLGIAMTNYPDSVLCSIDKDLLQLPGRHYNFVTKEEVTVTPKQAAFNFYAQVLSGDSTDNIPGIPGIGPVKAIKALEGCETPTACWNRIVELYNNHFGQDGEAYALEAARLVFVRRKVNQIWSPPSDVPAAPAEAIKDKKASSRGRVSKRARAVNSERLEATGSTV